jgi:hypothetical protein
VYTKCNAFMLFYTNDHSRRTTMPNAIYYEERHYHLSRRIVESCKCGFIRKGRTPKLIPQDTSLQVALWRRDDTAT